MFISQTTDFHFANYRFSFRKLQIFISQTTDSHFANYRFSFRKLQISISQSTDFHFANYRFPFRFANYSKPINSSSFYPSNSLRERTEYIPALNISGTSTLLDTAELETDRTSIRSSNLPGGCCSTVTIISTPTGSRNAAPAPLIMHEFVLFCGSLTTYLSFLLPSATIVKITILFAAKTSKRSIFFPLLRGEKRNQTKL